MRDWLAVAAVLPLVAATGAQAQMQGLAPGAIGEVARTRTLDLRVSQELGADRPIPLIRGIIVRHDVAPNAFVGLGLANIYSGKKAGSELRLGERLNRSKKPAVTFVLKF
jgi:hypothetical protein